MEVSKKSIVVQQKVAPVNLTTMEEQLEKWFHPPDQGYNLHPAIGANSSHYCAMSVLL